MNQHDEFELLSEITNIETIAIGQSIRELERIRRRFGQGRWRKLKGVATVRVVDTGEVREAEVHWYEAHGIGRVLLKVKHYLKG